jgi:rod shape-determining protein MreC
VPLGTLDRSPPPFFKQGPSALSKLMFFSALALFLMVADARFKITQPVRATVATIIYPLQWLAMRPLLLMQNTAGYFSSLQDAKSSDEDARKKLALQAQRAAQVEQLSLENSRLRKLLTLREQTSTSAQAAEILYDAADPYTRRLIVDKGLAHGIKPGSPVIDEAGVLGQVTRVYPLVSEVTLVIDREHAIPVLNTRTGARSVAYGDPTTQGGSLELRFMAGNADVQQGDILATSGVDGVYPAGLSVAKIDKIERRADSAFARIHCIPLALIHSTKHVLVLDPISTQIPDKPPAEPATPASKKAGKK